MILELRPISRQLGLLLLVLSGLLLLVALFAFAAGWVTSVPGDQSDSFALLISAGLGTVLSGFLIVIGRSSKRFIGQRDALLLVSVSWVFGAALAAAPFWFWSRFRSDAQVTPHPFDSYVDCYFEAMSGLTTTGATILSSIGTVPKSLMLWRALTQWLGGLGIVVLFVAVLPLLGVGGRRIFRLEATGPSPEGVRPRIHDAARVLWMIYLGLTALQILLLKACGMDWFDAVCHTFATLATGGYSTQDTSIGGFSSTAVQVVVIVFMILAGVNFGLYYEILQGRWRRWKSDVEFKAYLAILMAAFIIVSATLLIDPPAAYRGDAGQRTPASTVLRDALFQVVSIQTTTGFVTADFDQWGFTAKATLLVLMFIGGCAGSTAGGLKIVRILIGTKVVLEAVEHEFHPTVVRTTKIGRATIPADLKLGTIVYLLTIALLFAMGTALLMCLETGNRLDITTAATASAATLNNVGPGLAMVGATQTYAWFSAPSKVVLSFLMLLGRLEAFTVLVLFMPRFWRNV